MYSAIWLYQATVSYRTRRERVTQVALNRRISQRWNIYSASLDYAPAKMSQFSQNELTRVKRFYVHREVDERLL